MDESRLEAAIRAALEAENYEQAVDLLLAAAAERPLTQREYVNLGCWVILSEDRSGRGLEGALAAFRQALDLDNESVPALTEIGWYHYAIEDDANVRGLTLNARTRSSSDNCKRSPKDFSIASMSSSRKTQSTRC